MSGYVPIPHAAISVARGPLQRGALLDLYSRAHQAGYAPLLVTDRTLAEDWGLPRGEVWKLLEGLALAECIELERAAPRSKQATRVTVHPATSGLARQTGRQTARQTESQKTQPPMRASEISQPDRAPDGAPDGAPPYAEEIARASETRPDQTRPDQGRERARARPSPSSSGDDPDEERQRSTPRPPEPKGSGLPGGWVGTGGAVDEALSQVRDGGPEALAAVARISATIRGRPVGPSEASRDAPSVAAALELGGATLHELEAQVELVATWAQESPQGRDELGGIRLATGERWGLDRSRRPAVVLGPRWLDWLDAARAWDAGRVATATAPPSELYASPIEAATAAYGDPEAEARLDERALELVRRWKVSDGLTFEEAAK